MGRELDARNDAAIQDIGKILLKKNGLEYVTWIDDVVNRQKDQVWCGDFEFLSGGKELEYFNHVLAVCKKQIERNHEEQKRRGEEGGAGAGDGAAAAAEPWALPEKAYWEVSDLAQIFLGEGPVGH